MPPENPAVMKIAKPGVNVLTNSDPEKFIFNSEFGTLKYYKKETLTMSFDASTGDISCRGSVDHNLGHYPFVEVFVSVNGAAFQYCPFFGAGATVLFSANVKIDINKIWLYGEIDGMSDSNWEFTFVIFIFKNDLGL
jgi:hypothetical protein